jgi:hypothetical protein
MIINYCSGGLGNRLKPFSSCYAISKMTNRDLGAMWYPTMRCGAEYSDLFETKVHMPTMQELKDSKSVSIYSHKEWIDHDCRLNGNTTLKELSNIYGVNSVDNSSQIIHDTAKYIIVYSNNYLDGYSQQQCKEFFSVLSPLESLQKKIDTQVRRFGLNESIIGVHARGTDFEPGGVTVHTYINRMKELQNKYGNVTFFVCSDSKEYEDTIKSTFGEKVILNDKENWVKKNNESVGWVNNVLTPSASVQDSLVDMYLLAHTHFSVFHPDSTFAHIVIMLQQ